MPLEVHCFLLEVCTRDQALLCCARARVKLIGVCWGSSSQNTFCSHVTLC